MTAKAKAKPAAAAAPWKPVPVAVQVRRHHQAVVAARRAAALPARVKKANRVAARVSARKAARKAVAAKTAKKHGAPLAAGDVACCVAEALAMSLRLAGWPVTDQDVLELYWLTADHADEGASIPGTLAAAAAFGWPEASGLILGLDLPEGPHVVLEQDGIWWSWGEPYEPWDAPVTEAWAVQWRP